MLNSRDINLLRSDVAANCFKWIKLCKAAGLNVLVTNTVRDNEYQAYLYEQGRTRPGGIVTNSKVPTFHNAKCGLAFDFCKNVKGHEYDDKDFFRKAAAIAKKIGFSWGGDWKSFVDMPHVQWDANKTYNDAMIKVGKYPPSMPLYVEEGVDEVEKYKTLNDVPASYKPTIQKLIDKKVLNGVGDTDKDGVNELNIDETYCRVMTTLDRIGLFD